MAYDFTGHPLRTTHVHSAPSKTTQTESYTYDHAGRLLTTSFQLNGGDEVVLACNTCDELGRLASTTRNGNSQLTTEYEYNIRGWTTKIDGPLFSEDLYYNTSHNNSTPQWGGNVSAMDWKAGSTLLRGYTFGYDALSRLTSADYTEDGQVHYKYDTSYSYDLMGNMLSLQRNGRQDDGDYGTIDDVTFSYSGNQLVKADDNAVDPTYAGAFNFVDGSDADVEYEYDQNGNMTKDLNKNISSIQYNSLNLPTGIVYSDGRSAAYIYDAGGKKLRTIYRVSAQATSVLTDYCGNMIYENNVLKQILFDGGYVTLNGSTPVYHFYLKDHLGNNRVVANADGTIEQVNHYYPYGGLMGESTGGDTQRYKYNGKELDRMHGLDWYDYGARYMDGARGQFTTIDPLAGKYYNISPYAYCVNNPMKYIDPDGRKVVIEKKASSTFVDDYNKTIQTFINRGCGDVWKKLDESNETYTIVESGSHSNYFDPSNKTISWNSRMGLLTTSGNFISPATRLNHELDHALQFDTNKDAYNRDANTPAGGVDETYTMEEKRVIDGTESQTAVCLGEIDEGSKTRLDHSGSPFQTNSPISNEILNENKVIITPEKK